MDISARKKRWTKPLLAWTAVLLIVPLIAACAGPAGSTPASGASPSPNQVAGLEVWVHQGQPAEITAYKSIIDAFNRRYQGKIHASLTVIPSGSDNQYEAKVNAAFAAHKAPDVLDVDGPYIADYAYSGFLQPLDSWITPAMKKDFLPSIIQQGTWKGHVWALGAFTSSLVLFYNKDLFEKAGLAAPTTVADAWDWPRFTAALQTLKEKLPGVYPLDLQVDALPGEWGTYAFAPFIWSNGGRLLSPDGSATNGYVNGTPAVEAMTRVQELAKKGYINVGGTGTSFVEGKAAMQLTGPWAIANFKQYPNLRFGAIPLPYMKEKVSPTGSWAWGISKQSKHPQEAWKLMDWLLGTETGVVPIVKANSNPPARLSALKALPQYQSDPIDRLFMEQNQQTARPRPVTPAYPVLTQAFGTAVKNILLGGSVKGQLDDVARQTDDQLRSLGQ